MPHDEQRRAQRIDHEFKKLMAELAEQDAQVAELIQDNDVTEAELAEAHQVIAPHLDELNEALGFEEPPKKDSTPTKTTTPAHPFALRV